ncbi:MAG: YceI family protein [Pseudomonadota bacterium]
MVRRYSIGIAILLVALATLCTPLVATAEPKTYRIDPQHTHIVWSVDRFGFTRTFGSFAGVSGVIHYVADNAAKSTVNVAIDAAALRSDLSLREEILTGPHWFAVEQWPRISFETTSVSVAAGESCRGICLNVVGTLTLKGQSAPVTFSAAINKLGTDPVSGKEALGASATGELSRRALGLSIADGKIGDIVQFQIEVLAIAAD